MGTQQILLIVLSVIIVGAAIAVGISMFNNQAYSANKSAVAAEAQSYATQVVQYYKTPESQGGAGRDDTAGADGKMAASKIAAYIGWGNAVALDNDTGVFTIADAIAVPTDNTDFADDTIIVIITGIGKESKGGKSPHVSTTVGLPSGKIVAVVTDDVATTAPAGNGGS